MKKWVWLVALLSLDAVAEVYRWTDANGKVHFGDKKTSATAENITKKVNATNVDTSTQEHQKLESIFRKENDADREYQQQQQIQAQPDSTLSQRCENAKSILHKISGRIQVIDDDGKIVRVTEAERQQRVKELQQTINQNCPH